jgi:hypothetical protein
MRSADHARLSLQKIKQLEINSSCFFILYIPDTYKIGKKMPRKGKQK